MVKINLMEILFYIVYRNMNRLYPENMKTAPEALDKWGFGFK